MPEGSCEKARFLFFFYHPLELTHGIPEPTETVDESYIDGTLAVNYTAYVVCQLVRVHHKRTKCLLVCARVTGDEVEDTLLHFVKVIKGLRHPYDKAVCPYRMYGELPTVQPRLPYGQ